jgi:hypothetical protein
MNRELCRVAPLYPESPCPGCGYVSQKKPEWADDGVTFALDGKRYRIVAIGSTNRFAPRQMHYECWIYCEPVEDRWLLPNSPCFVDAVGSALCDFFKLPAFRSHELVGAYMIENVRNSR